LQQVVQNLLGNAVKFSPKGAGVYVNTTCCNGQATVSVQDHGVGIAPEFHEAIFDRFRQADGSIRREHGGMGLGLAICREIMEAHGGRVWVESVPGRGSTFHFSVSLAPRP